MVDSVTILSGYRLCWNGEAGPVTKSAMEPVRTAVYFAIKASNEPTCTIQRSKMLIFGKDNEIFFFSDWPSVTAQHIRENLVLPTIITTDAILAHYG